MRFNILTVIFMAVAMTGFANNGFASGSTSNQAGIDSTRKDPCRVDPGSPACKKSKRFPQRSLSTAVTEMSGQDQLPAVPRPPFRGAKFGGATKDTKEKKETTNTKGANFADQCRVKDGGCTRPLFPPKKPKLPTTTAANSGQDQKPPAPQRVGWLRRLVRTSTALQYGDSGPKKKKEEPKEPKPQKKEKLNIEIFE